MRQSLLLLFYCFIAVGWRMDLFVVSRIGFTFGNFICNFYFIAMHCYVVVIMVRVSWRSTLQLYSLCNRAESIRISLKTPR